MSLFLFFFRLCQMQSVCHVAQLGFTVQESFSATFAKSFWPPVLHQWWNNDDYNTKCKFIKYKMSSGFSLAVRSDSEFRTANDDRCSCVIVHHNQFLIRHMAEKLCSEVAVPTGSIKGNCTDACQTWVFQWWDFFLNRCYIKCYLPFYLLNHLNAL